MPDPVIHLLDSSRCDDLIRGDVICLAACRTELERSHFTGTCHTSSASPATPPPRPPREQSKANQWLRRGRRLDAGEHRCLEASRDGVNVRVCGGRPERHPAAAKPFFNEAPVNQRGRVEGVVPGRAPETPPLKLEDSAGVQSRTATSSRSGSQGAPTLAHEAGGRAPASAKMAARRCSCSSMKARVFSGEKWFRTAKARYVKCWSTGVGGP